MIGRIYMLLFMLAATGTAAPLLSIDFDCRTNAAPSNTQPGFASFLITSNISTSNPQTNATIRMFGTNRVQLWGNGLNRGYVDRWWPMPVNQGAFTESALLRDGVFSPDTGTNSGLNLLVENLPALQRVQVTIWSFDANSEPIRASDWYANGMLVREGYQFTNSVLPISNDQYRFSFFAEVDASGDLLIEGRRNPLSTNRGGSLHPGVYLNALRIEPEPGRILSIRPNGNELSMTFAVPPEARTYAVEEWSGSAWLPTSGVTYGARTNNRVTARLPRPTQWRLYRIRYGE